MPSRSKVTSTHPKDNEMLAHGPRRWRGCRTHFGCLLRSAGTEERVPDRPRPGDPQARPHLREWRAAFITYFRTRCVQRGHRGNQRPERTPPAHRRRLPSCNNYQLPRSSWAADWTRSVIPLDCQEPSNRTRGAADEPSVDVKLRGRWCETRRAPRRASSASPRPRQGNWPGPESDAVAPHKNRAYSLSDATWRSR